MTAEVINLTSFQHLIIKPKTLITFQKKEGIARSFFL